MENTQIRFKNMGPTLLVFSSHSGDYLPSYSEQGCEKKVL